MARLLLQVLALQLVILASVYGLFGSKKFQHATKYELQQKVLTLGSSYTVKNDKGEPVYKVRFHFSYRTFIEYFLLKIGFKKVSLGKHLQLTDVSGQKEYYASKNIHSIQS
jgi:uncharacterized protein YxjI